jgi:hypothetical protein
MKKVNAGGSYYVFVFLLALLVGLVGCGYQGSMPSSERPVIQITSYTGEDDMDYAIGNAPVPYQQIIYWSAWASDGVVVGYAYRVLDEDGKPISTAGNSFIDADGSVTPDVLKNDEFIDPKNGWVLHYERGALEDYPLDSPYSKRTVWTERVFTVVNFPSIREGDNIIPLPSSFEVVAINNRGVVSKPAIKHFYTTSAKSQILIASSRGALVGEPKTLGMGIKITFRIDGMNTGSVGTVPVREWFFRYRLYRETNDSAATIVPGSDTGWELYSTLTEPKVDEVVLTGWGSDTTPELVSNFPSGSDTPTSITVLEAVMVDLAGVESDVARVKFYIDDRFRPSTLIYMTHTYVLGEHHFVDTQDNSNIDVPPSMTSNEGVRVSAPFTVSPVLNSSGDIESLLWSTVGNEQTRFWFRWGYNGEFENNSPNEKVKSELLDANGVNYYSEVSYFHIRLNGQQIHYPPLQGPGMQPRPDWLRVPVNHEISQRLAINGLNQGMNTLEVAVEDLQGLLDPDPAKIEFLVAEPKPIIERSGVLYIDCNRYTEASDQASLISFYQEVMQQAGLDFTYLHRETLFDRVRLSGGYNIRLENHLFPVAYLQNFKYVIYASDSYSANLTTLSNDFDGLRLFMRGGGTMVLIGNQNLVNQARANNRLLTGFFGFPVSTSSSSSAFGLTSTVGGRQYYFKGATGQSGYPDINAYFGQLTGEDDEYGPTYVLGSHPDWLAGRNISSRRGLPSVTYFREANWPQNTTPLYRFRSKLFNEEVPGAFNSPQTQAEFDSINNSIVAFRFNPPAPRGVSYTFGFPWYHLEKSSVVDILNKIKQE